MTYQKKNPNIQNNKNTLKEFTIFQAQNTLFTIVNDNNGKLYKQKVTHRNQLNDEINNRKKKSK